TATDATATDATATDATATDATATDATATDATATDATTVSDGPPAFDDGLGDLPPIDAYDDLGGDEDDYIASEPLMPAPLLSPARLHPSPEPVPSSAPEVASGTAGAQMDEEDTDEDHRPPVGGDAAPLFPGLFDPPALPRSSASLGGDGSAATGDSADVAIAVPTDLPGADDFGVSLGRVEAAWPGLHARVKAERVHIGALLTSAQPHRVHRGAVEVAVPDQFTCDLLTSETARLTAHLAAELGTEARAEDTPALRFVVAAPEALPETPASADPFEAFKHLRQTHPVVRLLFERFGAEIVY
ncbi:MAG: hypothetical protein AAGG50_06995, partial [Bacteroidota bacterium]